MSDLISGSALIKELEYHCEEGCKPNSIGGIVTGAVRDCIKIVNSQPTIEAVPVVHGEWMMRGGKAYCSKCGKLALHDQDRDDWWYYCKSNFCPDCGADMRKGGE